MRKGYKKYIFRIILAVGFVVIAGSYKAGRSDAWKVYPRIFTPAGAQNNVVKFSFPDPDPGGPGVEKVGRVYDIQGHRVINLALDSEGGNFTATWDGNDADSNPVRSGIYIYHVTVSTKVYNGTVVLAR